jgi:hypothetical protein
VAIGVADDEAGVGLGVRRRREAAGAFGHEAIVLFGLQSVTDVPGALLAIGPTRFGMGVAATAHMPKFRNKQRPEAAPSSLN